MLAHQRPGPGCGLFAADQQRGAVPVPGLVQLGLVQVGEGAIFGEGGTSQPLEVILEVA